MNRSEALLEYGKAQKQGQRAYREALAHGRSPYLPVLDDILKNEAIDVQQPVGLAEIPLEMVIGTKTAGRTAAFAYNFMPLLGMDTEFCAKWTSLYAAHVDEGIRDPVRVFEYRGRFFVQEGNKRVSVLKYVGADSISAQITRIVPTYSDDPAIRAYYEFMDYYRLTGIYQLSFTQEGSFEKFQALLGKQPKDPWTEDERAAVLSLCNWVKKAFHARGGADLPVTVGDVLLILLKVYPLEELQKQSPAQLAQSLDSVWDDVLSLCKPHAVKVSTQPAGPAQASLLERIIPAMRSTPGHLKVAFVNVRTPETSTWTNAHEFGRTQLDQVFAGKVTTRAYNGAEPGKNDDSLLERA
ncbi:MAG: BMP family ABC transporter substrate-binding protein, partial [Gemmiger sp.]